ncbi:MAG: glycosyltransferase WbuB [Acidobacteriaceae bacterium]
MAIHYGNPQLTFVFYAHAELAGSTVRLLFLGLNYTPELTGIGKYSGEMMEWLAARGHEVRVVTAPPYYPAWRVSDGYSGWRYRREVSAAGAEIYRCPLWVPAKPNGIRRVVHLSSFALSSLPVMLVQAAWRPDLVLTVEPAFTCAPAALLAARLCGAPAWLHIQDFEVDAAFDLGLLPSGGWAQRLAQSCERMIRRRFSQFSTISASMMARLLQKGIEPSRITFFPNWVDVDAIYPQDQPSAFRAELGIGSDQIVLLYSGNMGAKQGLEILPQLAARLQDRKQLHFVFCGDGAYRGQLEQAAAGFENVTFLPLQPLERLNDLLNMADIHLLPQRAGAADLVMPSKLTGMLASGRPVVATAAVGTQVAAAVEGRGIAVAPGDPSGLAQAVILLAENPALRGRLGNAARLFAGQELARDSVLMRFEAAMEGVLTRAGRSTIAESSTS